VSDRSDVLIIGGGVIGVCSAYYLLKQGASVTLLEQDEICSGSSWGNAGWLVPSHSMPLAQRGAVIQGLRWMLNPESPFYIKPRPSMELLRWLWRFRSVANAKSAQQSARVAVEFSQVSSDLYKELIDETNLDCYYEQKGLIGLYLTEDGFHEGLEEAKHLVEFGVESQALDTEQVLDMEPAVRPGIAGGIYHSGDSHLKPDDLVKGLAAKVEEMGGTIHENTAVTGFDVRNNKIIAVKSDIKNFEADQIVLATGAWSSEVVGDLKLDLPIQPAKGYSITFGRPVNPPSFPVMLAEAKVGVTPMGPSLRFAGTLELSGLNTNIDERRVKAIRRAGDDFLVTGVSSAKEFVWCGMRPLTPDNLPIIGRVDWLSNLIVAAGHSMTGVTLGASTGKMVSQLVAGEETVVDPAPFSPMRFQ
jgi:D-amino-acid dehydrogenase